MRHRADAGHRRRQHCVGAAPDILCGRFHAEKQRYDGDVNQRARITLGRRVLRRGRIDRKPVIARCRECHIAKHQADVGATGQRHAILPPAKLAERQGQRSNLCLKEQLGAGCDFSVGQPDAHERSEISGVRAAVQFIAVEDAIQIPVDAKPDARSARYHRKCQRLPRSCQRQQLFDGAGFGAAIRLKPVQRSIEHPASRVPIGESFCNPIDAARGRPGQRQHGIEKRRTVVAGQRELAAHRGGRREISRAISLISPAAR